MGMFLATKLRIAPLLFLLLPENPAEHAAHTFGGGAHRVAHAAGDVGQEDGRGSGALDQEGQGGVPYAVARGLGESCDPPSAL